MGFGDLNENIRQSSGSFLNLNKKGEVATFTLMDVKVQGKVFKGNKVMNAKTGEQRVEWLFTVEDFEGRIKKWAAGEVAQWAIKQALKGDPPQQLEKGGKMRVEVIKSSVQGESQAEITVEYIPPAFLAVDTNDTTSDPDFGDDGQPDF